MAEKRTLSIRNWEGWWYLDIISIKDAKDPFEKTTKICDPCDLKICDRCHLGVGPSGTSGLSTELPSQNMFTCVDIIPFLTKPRILTPEKVKVLLDPSSWSSINSTPSLNWVLIGCCHCVNLEASAQFDPNWTLIEIWFVVVIMSSLHKIPADFINWSYWLDTKTFLSQTMPTKTKLYSLK